MAVNFPLGLVNDDCRLIVLFMRGVLMMKDVLYRLTSRPESEVFFLAGSCSGRKGGIISVAYQSAVPRSSFGLVDISG